MATPAPNPRASLLAGLRTGGVRSSSGPVPRTADPAGTFIIPRIVYPSEEEEELSNQMAQNMYIQDARSRQAPVTAAVDGVPNRFQHQQHQTMTLNGAAAPFTPMSPAMAQNQIQIQQLLMQMELTRLQALQNQQYQYQAELLATQAQLAQQQQRQQANRRAASYAFPSTAGPTNTSFDFRASTVNAQMRRTNQADQLRSKLGVVDDQVPMTAALNGKFGSRVISGNFESDFDDFSSRAAAIPNYTTVISGGTSLGAPNTPTVPSKSDAAVSWRRAPGNNSVLSANRSVTSPTVRVTPPPSERVSPPLPNGKVRPTPLRFTAEASPVAVAIDAEDADDSSTSSKSGSSPSTPQSTGSGDVPLSPREEAAKKLYEGLGIGRPTPGINVVVPQDSHLYVQRLVSTPVRQPRGPPSNTEELVPKNFATRSRRKAIDALMDARERREVVVEAY